jgi:hypothetical protein
VAEYILNIPGFHPQHQNFKKVKEKRGREGREREGRREESRG